MTIDEKIKICEDLLLSFDFDLDSDDYMLGHYDRDYMKDRLVIIVMLLKKLELVPAGNWDEILSDIDMNIDIIYHMLVDESSWGFATIFPDYVCEIDNANYDFLKKDDEDLSSEEKLEKERVLGLLSEIHPDLSSKQFLDLIIRFLEYGEEEIYLLNILYNSHIEELLNKNLIKKECLEPLRYPLILVPPGYDPQLTDSWLSGFLTGSSCYYSEQVLSFADMNSMFLICIAYVELAYRKYKDLGKKLSISGFCFN